MRKDVIAVDVVGPHRLHLTFADGVSGEVDVARLVAFEGVFAPLSDPDQFSAVQVSTYAGTVVWPNGADLDPDVLYAEVIGEPVERHHSSGHAS